MASKTTWRPGQSFGNVDYTIDYLQNPEGHELGDTVAIISAGNSAMDAARTALRQSSRFVTFYCGEKEATNRYRELDYAIADGVHILYGMEVKEISSAGPIFIEHTFEDARNVIAESEPKLCPADSTIIAVSQRPKDKLVNTTSDLKANDRALMEVKEHGQTTRP